MLKLKIIDESGRLMSAIGNSAVFQFYTLCGRDEPEPDVTITDAPEVSAGASAGIVVYAGGDNCYQRLPGLLLGYAGKADAAKEAEHRLIRANHKRFFEDYITNGLANEVINNAAVFRSEYGIAFSGDRFRAISISVDPFPRQTGLLDAVADVMEDCLRPRLCELVVYVKGRTVIVVMNDRRGSQDLKQVIEGLRRRLQEAFEDCMLTIGVSGEAADVMDLEKIVNQAKAAVYQRLSDGVGRILYYDSIYRPKENIRDYLTGEDRAELTRCVLLLNTDGCCKRVSEIYDRYPGGVDAVLCTVMLNDALTDALNSAKKDFVVRGRNESRNAPPMADDVNSLLELRSGVLGWITDMLALLRKDLRQLQMPAVRAAICLVEANLSGPLRMEDVAKQVGLASSYFSALFKQQTGATFTEYVSKRRMEKAKELLAESRHKVGKIAGMVGFEDNRHFSRVFFKHTGVTPTQYRMNHFNENTQKD